MLIHEEMAEGRDVQYSGTCHWVCTLFLPLPQGLALGHGGRQERGLWPSHSSFLMLNSAAEQDFLRTRTASSPALWDLLRLVLLLLYLLMTSKVVLKLFKCLMIHLKPISIPCTGPKR